MNDLQELFNHVAVSVIAQGGSGLRVTLSALCEEAAPGNQEVYHLLHHARDAHDDCAGASDWREQFVSRMRGVALSFNLSTDELDEAAKAAGWTT